MKIETIEDFILLALQDNILPPFVKRDVSKRIMDWLSDPNNSKDDPYIKQQLKFIENYISVLEQHLGDRHKLLIKINKKACDEGA